MRTWIVYFTLKGRNKLLRNKCQNNDLVLAIKTISIWKHTLLMVLADYEGDQSSQKNDHSEL